MEKKYLCEKRGICFSWFVYCTYSVLTNQIMHKIAKVIKLKMKPSWLLNLAKYMLLTGKYCICHQLFDLWCLSRLWRPKPTPLLSHWQYLDVLKLAYNSSVLIPASTTTYQIHFHWKLPMLSFFDFGSLLFLATVNWFLSQPFGVICSSSWPTMRLWLWDFQG